MIDLTRAEAAAVAQMIEFNIFDSIRNDPGIDNLQWLVAMVHAWEKLDAASKEPEEPKTEDSGSEAKDSSKRRGRKPKKAELTQEQKLRVVLAKRKGKAVEEVAEDLMLPESQVREIYEGGDGQNAEVSGDKT